MRNKEGLQSLYREIELEINNINKDKKMFFEVQKMLLDKKVLNALSILTGNESLTGQDKSTVMAIAEALYKVTDKEVFNVDSIKNKKEEYITSEPIFYNEMRKINFINQHVKEKNKHNYIYVLSKAKEYEEYFNKDLCHFSFEEMEALLYGFNAKTIESLSYQAHIINKYIEYVLEKGIVENSINLKMFKHENLDKYVNKITSMNRIVTRHQLYNNIIKECTNAQDAVIYSLIFEGVYGEDLSELYNLKISDVDEMKSELKLNDKSGSKRVIKVPDETIQLIIDAHNEMFYYKTSDNYESVRGERFELNDSDYVLKNTKRKNARTKISSQTIRQRFIKIRNHFDSPHITPSSIRLSGMIDMARQIKYKEGVVSISKEHLNAIFRQFNVSINNFYATKAKIERYV